MPGDRPYTRREMRGMSNRGLSRALERRSGGRFSDDELKERERRLGSGSGARFTDAELKSRMNRVVGRRQGYKDREDESLGMRRGPERDSSQSFKDRRDESYGRWGTRDARRRRGER